MRTALILLGLTGLALATGLIAWRGAEQVGAALLAAGWALALVPFYSALPLSLDSMGWRRLARGGPRPGFATFLAARWIRQSVNHLLPVAQIGGEVVGARLLVLRGVPAAEAGASVVVDLTLGVATQVVFTLIGLVALSVHYRDDGLAAPVLIGALLLAAGTAGFVVAQRRGLFAGGIKGIGRLAGGGLAGLASGAARLDRQVRSLYGQRRTLWRSALWRLAGWLAGVGEVWIALHLLGHPVGLVEALILQALGQAVRSAAFAVPGALGVQEGGYMVLAVAIGLGPDVGLALSLVKRVRELAVGIPGLIAWQLIEGRRALFARTPPGAGEAPSGAP